MLPRLRGACAGRVIFDEPVITSTKGVITPQIARQAILDNAI